MLIFEYRCNKCSSVFEALNGVSSITCVMCGNSDVSRVDSMLFSPKKDFCPRKHSVDLLGKNERKCYYGCGKNP